MRCNFNARLIAGVFVSIWLAACSTPQTSALKKITPPGLPTRAELQDTAYFSQDEFQCGPAALAMVLKSLGSSIQPDDLKRSLYIPDKQGSLQVEMLATARKQGYLAYTLQPQLQDVLTEVSAGNPVIVLQNLGLSWHPVWHYAVVIGYDLNREEIILRSGTEQRLIMPFSTFEHTWARSQYWAMLALPVTRLPATALPEPYAKSLAALERSSPHIYTGEAHQAALQRWPDIEIIQIAAGNHAYTHGKLQQAEQLFLETTTRHPNSVAALNNLAQTQSDLGKLDEALQTIARAVALGGPLREQAIKTQQEIEQKKSSTPK